MKRLHVHVSVEDLDQSIGFYTDLFGTAPGTRKEDYAKWMLEDPCVNFAISSRGRATGVSHLGLQMESGEELTALRGRLADRDHALLDQKNEACCYARSDKVWVDDPQGVAWENFVTLGSLETFGEDALDPDEPADKAAATPSKVDTADTCCPTAEPDCCAPTAAADG